MNLLILKGFNNYFNRIAVRYETLEQYQEASDSSFNFSNVNFNPKDGVNTEIIIGNENQQKPVTSVVNEQTVTTYTPLDWEFSGSPDYLVCYEQTTSGTPPETVSTIISRWYIMECDRTRNGQYNLLLKRDSISDHYEEVEKATCFIEKGAISNKDDPGIFNKEPIETNQIKSAEYLLKDETQCGWVVGYVAKDRWDGSTIVDTTFASTEIPDDNATDNNVAETYTSLSDFQAAHADIIGTLGQVSKIELDLRCWIRQRQGLKSRERENIITLDLVNRIATFKETGEEKKLDDMLETDGLYTDFVYFYTAARWDYRDYRSKPLYASLLTDEYEAFMREQIGNNEGLTVVSDSTIKKFQEYVSKGIMVKIANRYYEVIDEYADGWGKSSIVADEADFNTYSTPFVETTNRLNKYYNIPLSTGDTTTMCTWYNEPNDNTYKIRYSLTRHKLYLKEKFVGLKAKTPITIPILKDAPYYMFAIPYSDNLALWSGNTLHCTTKQSVAINAAQALATKNGGGTVYDVQLLPYCPVRNIIKTTKVTEAATFPNGTFNTVTCRGPDTLPMDYEIVILNHQYVINKNITLADNKYYGIRSSSPIYVDFATGNLENPTETWLCSQVEITHQTPSDTTTPWQIKIWKRSALPRPLPNVNPDYVINYSDYVSSNNIIGIYCTDICTYKYTTSNPIVSYTSLTENGTTLLDARGEGLPEFFTDYIYHEDYYLSKIDISEAVYSDIVKVNQGVEGDIVSTIFWCPESKFTFDRAMDDYYLLSSNGSSYIADPINNLINSKVKRGKTIQDIKVKNQVDMMRLASPNYSNFFDINIERNLGVEFINIDCTYKPYSPYLHLNPNFKGLYGNDYDDVRGLICGGDFSIALTNDAWSTYQLQNKNYQSIFDRQIQQLEVADEIQRQMDKWKAGAGVFTGAASGAITGAMASGGNPYAAIGGAVVGGVMSGLAGNIDIQNAQRLRSLQINTSKDIFSMQLNNIKALPQGLAKTNYLTNNNKLFPFLEFYTCTPVEEQAVRDYIKFNGMTINRIGKIMEFQISELIPYIKAKLLRINIKEDAHQVEDIANELAMGVYIPLPETLLPDEEEII